MCDGTPERDGKPAKKGIKQQVAEQVAKIGSSYSAYDIECNLATKGEVHARQSGSTLTLAYQLTNQVVTFRATSPFTCNPKTAGACPNDPRFVVRFANQIVVTLRTPSLCKISADIPAKGYAVAASIEGDNAAADIARFFQANKFIAAELAITSTVEDLEDLPLDSSFKKLRESPICTGAASSMLRNMPKLETELDVRNRRIVMRSTHPGIKRPQVGAPNAAAPPEFPKSFTRPEISLSQPFVQAGNSIQVSGKNFPRNVNLAKSLPVTFQHEGYANNSSLPACGGAGTDLQWGPTTSQPSVQRVKADATGRCPGRFELTNLSPNTAYQLRARDCDLITCSAWSAPVRVTTARTDATPGQVILTLDSGTRPHQPNRPWDKRPRPSGQLGTATTDANGVFTATVTIPAGTPAGTHTIHAVAGTAKTSENFQVTAVPGTGTGWPRTRHAQGHDADGLRTARSERLSEQPDRLGRDQ